jgi:hypothetical protein
MIKLKDILSEIISEMGSMTIKPILDLYKSNPELVSKVVFPYKNGIASEKEIENELSEMGYNEFKHIRNQLDLNPLEEACWKGYQKDRKNPMKKKGDRMVPNCVRKVSEEKKQKIKKAYLTKDAAAMKKEINRVKKLKDDDPSAYGKWEADYADKDKTKKYKTKKSVATTAYEKRFGKKEK